MSYKLKSGGLGIISNSFSQGVNRTRYVSVQETSSENIYQICANDGCDQKFIPEYTCKYCHKCKGRKKKIVKKGIK